MVLIRHTTIDTTVNLNPEKIVKNLSGLIYESFLTIDTSAESNVNSSLLIFVKALQWDILCMWFPIEREIGHLCCLWSWTSPRSLGLSLAFIIAKLTHHRLSCPTKHSIKENMLCTVTAKYSLRIWVQSVALSGWCCTNRTHNTTAATASSLALYLVTCPPCPTESLMSDGWINVKFTLMLFVIFSHFYNVIKKEEVCFEHCCRFTFIDIHPVRKTHILFCFWFRPHIDMQQI